MNFARALELESRHLIRLLPGEPFDPFINAVVIGPGAVDLLAAGHEDQVIAGIEAGKFAAWKQQDLEKFYRERGEIRPSA